MRTLCYILGVFGARDTPTHLIRVVANFSLDGVAARLACAALRKLPMMMGVRRGGSDFARGSCLPARPDLPVGAGNWRGAGSPRPFYSNTMTDGRADRVAPHRGAAVVIGGAPTLLLDGEPCGPGVPGSQVLRRGGVIRFAAGPQMPAGGGSGGGLCPFWQAARAVPPGPPLSVGVV